MRKWEHKLELQDIWKNRNAECGPASWDDNTIHELAKEISRRIKRKFPRKMIDGDHWDPNLTEIVDWFDSIQTWGEYKGYLSAAMVDQDISDEELSTIREQTPMKEFNTVMDLLYDWADRESVWVNK